MCDILSSHTAWGRTHEEECEISSTPCVVMHHDDAGALCQVSQHNEGYVQASIASLGLHIARLIAVRYTLHHFVSQDIHHYSLPITAVGLSQRTL